MKKIILSLLVCLMALPLCAESLTWLTSLPDAQTQAQKENKMVMLFFTGSDWCLDCKLLQLEVLKKQEFIDYAKKNLVLVEVDFPLGIKQSPELEASNQALTNKFNIIGKPELVVLSPSGKLAWHKLGYFEGGPQVLLTELDKAKKIK